MYGLKGHAVHYTYILHIIIVLNVYLLYTENGGNLKYAVA